MESTNKNRNDQTSADLLASCGFMFPQDELALARFNILYGEIDPDITGEEVDAYKIIRNSPAKQKKVRAMRRTVFPRQNKMVANKLKPIPAHILQRLKKGGSDSDKPEEPLP